METLVFNPRLSICIVVRDRLDGLERTLRSLESHRQKLEACGTEVVVIDGQSRDGSEERARSFALAMHGHLPVIVHSQSPRGIYSAMNQACRLASGEWLLFLNAGDLLMDGALVGEAIAAAENQGAHSVQCQMAVFPPGGRRAFWLPGRPVRAHQALLYKRDLHRRIGPYDDRLRVCADTLLLHAIEKERQMIWARLLAATDVSPVDASRDPRCVRHDLTVIMTECLPIRPWPRPRLTLVVLGLERILGISLSVWIRLTLELVRGHLRIVSLD